MAGRAKRWVYTLNNPTDDDEQDVGTLHQLSIVEYHCFGRERGTNGTLHFQGFICFKERKTITQVRALLGRAHWEVSRGSPQQASDYCKKDGDYEEYGDLPEQQGKRSDIDAYKLWLEGLDHYPSCKEIAKEHTGLYLKYKDRLLELRDLLLPDEVLEDGTPNDWQVRLAETLTMPADDRAIIFAHDPDGGKGKSWFTRWLLSQRPDDVQVLGIGKRDDIAHMVEPDKRVYLFNVGRTQMEYLQYSVLEMLKDRLVVSPKYNSRVKVLKHKAHVVVFCNEAPDMDKMTQDRYILFDFN